MASLLKLRTNPGFDEYYITRYADLMNTMFNCDTMLNFLESQYNLIKPEMARHIDRFGGTMDEWEHNYLKLKNYISQRCEKLPDVIASCYNIDGPYEVTFDVDPPGEGSLNINSLTVHDFPYTAKYYGGIDTKVEAVVRDNATYAFDHWETTETSPPGEEEVARIEIQNAGTVIAHFASLISGVKDFESEGYSFTAQPTLTSGKTTAIFELPINDGVEVQLFDMLGHPYNMLLQASTMQAGQYQLELDLAASGLSAGTYVLRFQTDKGFVKTVRVVLQ